MPAQITKSASSSREEVRRTSEAINKLAQDIGMEILSGQRFAPCIYDAPDLLELYCNGHVRKGQLGLHAVASVTLENHVAVIDP